MTVERRREAGGSRRNLITLTHDRSVDRVHIDGCMLDEHYPMFRKTKAEKSDTQPTQTTLPEDDDPF